MDAQFRLSFTILHRLTEIQQALILPTILNILLYEAQLV